MEKDHKKKQDEDFRYLVRIANTDLKGEKNIFHALTSIKGVGIIFSNFLCTAAGIEKTKKAGTLSDAEVKKLDEILREPLKFNAPKWMLNRRNDVEEGTDRHLITVDLDLSRENDIKRMKKTKSYKGMRHALRLTLRGQRTRSNFRKNKGKVTGVSKKKGKSGRV